MRDRLVSAGVKQLRDFGYPKCNASNITKDKIYRLFFLKMLEGTRDDEKATKAMKGAASALILEIVSAPPTEKI
jgi:hypothetical protein